MKQFESAKLTQLIDALIKDRQVWNRSEFARAVGKDKSNISRIEKGATLTEQFVDEICKVFPRANKKFFTNEEDNILLLPHPVNGDANYARVGGDLNIQKNSVEDQLIQMYKQRLEDARRQIEFLAEQLRNSNRINEWLQQQLDKRQ